MSRSTTTQSTFFASLVVLFACTSSGSGPAGSDVDAGTFDGPCLDEAAVRAQVFAPSCTSSSCHDARRPKAGLDLQTPGVRMRLLDVRSIHDACSDRLLLVPGDPATSFLMDKVLGRQGACGEPMPELGALEPSQRRCVAEWIASMPVE